MIEFVEQQILMPLDAAAMFDLQSEHIGGFGAFMLQLEGFDIGQRRSDFARRRRGLGHR